MIWINACIIRVPRFIRWVEQFYLLTEGITLICTGIILRIGQWIEYEFNTNYKPTEADGSPAC